MENNSETPNPKPAGFQPGNQFWKMRSKHGRDAIFTDPTKLAEAADEYFTWCDNNPIYKAEQSKTYVKPIKVLNGVGEETEIPASQIVQIPMARPYTFQGLCRFLCANLKYFNEFEKTIQHKLANPEMEKDKKLSDFSEICSCIRETIYQQKFEGAAVGLFNNLLISRDLGLADKTETRSVDVNGDDVKPADVQVFVIGGKEIRF